MAAVLVHLRRSECAVSATPDRRIALVDLLDRVLGGGVVVAGEITLSIADVDMVHISLRTLVSSVSALTRPSDEKPENAG
ncbi:gas vesicle protein GvpA [Prescottella equi]|nr:gas vesicle protein GvpA [Prescottella equi]